MLEVGEGQLLSPGSLAAQAITQPQELDLDSSGRPRAPVQFIDLDQPTDAESVRAAAAAARNSLALCVGIAGEEPDDRLRELMNALTLTLVPAGTTTGGVAHVPVGDPATAGQALAQAVGAAPGAAIALNQLLRQTEVLDVRSGLVAEAAAYSMLLTGTEFARWLAARGPARIAHQVNEPLRLRRDGHRLSITLDRPERRNALDAAMREALVDALAVAVADPTVHVELAGAGSDFCSGGDLDEFGTATDAVAAYLVRLGRSPGWLLHHVAERATAYVHGACIGAGTEIPAFAGRVVAAPTAWFRLPEVGMGLVPGAGGTVSISRRIGRWRTAWMALTGARVDAATALSWGLIDEIGSW